jgi:predicted permease
MIRDLRYALRTLRASPVTSVSVVLTLALGIGALGTMYGLVSTLLLQPPPHVAEPDRVRRLFFHYEQPGEPPATTSRWIACVTDRLRAEAVTLEDVSAFTGFDVSVGAGADAARARAAVVSAGFWSTLGTRAAIGRLFADDEARPEAGPRIAVLGHAFWQQRYGGDPGVIGRTLRIRGEPFEIVGVTPRGFRGIEPSDVDLWLPLSAYTLSSRNWENDTTLSHVVRLAPGVTPAQADADLSRALADVVDQDAGCEQNTAAAAAPAARLSVTAGPLAGGLGSDMRLTADARVTVWLVGVALALLGVACANVAGVLLQRALGRRREIAVRLALGMSLRRLAMQLFMESATLAAIGGAAALAVVVWGGAWLNRMLLPQRSPEAAAAVDLSMVVLTAACVAGAAFLSSFAPVLQARADPIGALREGTASATFRRGRLHGALLVTQTALSVVLLTGAGLFLVSLHNVRSLDLGLDPDNVLVATVDFAGTGRPGPEVSAFYERALDRVRALPGVDRASLARSIPLRSARAGSIRPSGHAEPLTAPGGDATYVNDVAPGFFATVGTRIVEGRDFLPHERDGAPVVVVNEAVARAGWPGRSPIGECVEVEGGGPCATVVGVVANARRFFLSEPVALLFYRPLPSNAGDRERALLVRVAPGTRESRTMVARVMQALEPGLPFVRVQSLGDALDPQTRPWRLGATVLTAFGALAVLLAALGLYGALSYAVMQRRREMAVRVALGASALDVVRLVLRDSLRIALAGVVAGTAIGLVAGRWMADLLFEVSPRDPFVFGAVGASLIVVAVLAALVPSRQATRVDPMVALRAE